MSHKSTPEAKPRRLFNNLIMAPAGTQRNVTRDGAKAEFARRLQEQMVKRGFNQSELAREAKKHVGKNVKFGRDSVSRYIAGDSLPRPVHLSALCKALDCRPEDLLPTRGIPTAGDRNSPFALRDLGDGNVEIKMNQIVPWSIALEMIEKLKKELK